MFSQAKSAKMASIHASYKQSITFVRVRGDGTILAEILSKASGHPMQLAT